MLIQRIALTFFLSFSILGSSSAEEPLKKDNPPSGLTPLTRAIRLEKFEQAQKHITPALVNKMDQGQYHPLTYAAYTSNNELIETLLKAGADPNVVEHNGKTALYVAANMANVEGIKLLHKYGAKQPPETALSAAVAATHSGNITTLKKLLHYYPDIDINRGWRSDSKSSPSQFNGALLYATYYGYNDIALFLLTQKVNVQVSDRSGKTALHYAAQNEHCTQELIQKLVALGLSPIQNNKTVYHSIPSTPLDFASIQGNQDKVKALVPKNLSKEEKRYINSSAHKAAAYGRDETCHYLFRLLGKDMPSSEQWLEKKINSLKKQGKDINRIVESDSHNPIKLKQLNEILPRTKLSVNVSYLTGTIAVVAPDSLLKLADLITSELSQTDEITVLERNTISRVIQENSLNHFKQIDSARLHANLDLIPAAHILIISKEQINKSSFIQLNLIESGSGIVVSQLSYPSQNTIIEEKLKEATSILLKRAKIDRQKDKQKTAISFTSIQPETASSEVVNTASLANTLLPHHINTTPGCITLTRNQLLHLETEKAIGIKESYWSAAWVVDGGVSVSADKQLIFTLRATSSKNGITETVKEIGASYNSHQIAKNAWRNLAKKLQLKETVADNEPDKGEADILLGHASWLLDAHNSKKALSLSKSAIALGLQNSEAYEIALRSAILSLPNRTNSYCNHIQKNPNYLGPTKRFLLAEQLQTYSNLCDIAIGYVQHMQPMRGLRADYLNGSFTWTYNGYISQTLSEVIFFRCLMDHLMIKKCYPDEIRSLDKKIQNLTNTYLRKSKNHRGDMATCRMLLEKSYNYYARYHVDIFQNIVNRSVAHKIWESQAIELSNKGQQDLLKKWENSYIKAPTRKHPDIRQAEIIAQIHLPNHHGSRTKNLSKLLQNYYLVLKSQEIPYHKIESIMRLTKYRKIKQVIDLLGIDSPFIYDNKTKSINRAIPGPLAKDNSFTHTGEFYRNFGIYAWLRHLQFGSKHLIRGFLNDSLEQAYSQKPSEFLSDQDWNIIQQTISKRSDFDQDWADLLEKVIFKSNQHSETSASVIYLKDPILLPPSQINPDLGQFAVSQRASLHNNELWIPVIYQKIKRTSSVPEEYHHAIHVLSLDSGKIKTIELPRDLPRGIEPKLYTSEVSTNQGWPIIIGQEFAYYSYDFFNLVSIDINSLSAEKIKLPAPYKRIDQIAHIPNSDIIYAALSDRYTHDLTSNIYSALAQVKGRKTTKILASSHRKLKQSPLDHPSFNYTGLLYDTTDKQLKVRGYDRRFSPRNGKHYNTAAAYHTPSSKWNAMSYKGLDTEMRKRVFKNRHTPFTHPSLRINNNQYYTIHLNKSYNAAITLSTSKKNISNVSISNIINPTTANYYQQIEVAPPHLETASFNKPIYLKKLKGHHDDGKTELIHHPPYNYRGWWYTPNQLIEQKAYNAHIIGEWNNHFIVSLHQENLGFPAIWLIPTKKIKEEVHAIHSISPSPISFDLLTPGPFTSLNSEHYRISTNSTKARITENNGIFETPSLLMEGNDTHTVSIEIHKNHVGKFNTLSLQLQRGNRTKPVLTKVYTLKNKTWGQIFSDNKSPLAVKDSSSFYPMSLPIPSSSSKLKLEFTSTEKGGVNIDDIILR